MAVSAPMQCSVHESPTTSQVHLRKAFQFSFFHQAKMVGRWPPARATKGIKQALEQSFVVIGYEVQKHRQKLDYLDEDGTRVEAIEPTQVISKEINSRKVTVMTEV